MYEPDFLTRQINAALTDGVEAIKLAWVKDDSEANLAGAFGGSGHYVQLEGSASRVSEQHIDMIFDRYLRYCASEDADPESNIPHVLGPCRNFVAAVGDMYEIRLLRSAAFSGGRGESSRKRQAEKLVNMLSDHILDRKAEAVRGYLGAERLCEKRSVKVTRSWRQRLNLAGSVWKDPVGSKLIAEGIILSLSTLLAAYLLRR